MVINVVLNIVFIEFFFRRVQNGGPALATALACYFDFFALLLIFRLRYGVMGMRDILRSFSKILLCSAIMGVACWLGGRYTEFTIHSRFVVQLGVFAALIGGATVLYLTLAWVFRCSEMEEIYGIATRRNRGDESYAEA